MLLDKDRIFTNLYGLQDWRLEGAKKRGAWNATADLMSFGPDWISTRSRRPACADAAARGSRRG